MSDTDSKDICDCGEVAVQECANCKKKVCDNVDCGQDTVDGYLCGSYTINGCGRKYTTCDTCLDDKAIHEGDMNYCASCGNSICDRCLEENTCTECDDTFCDDCLEEHLEDCGTF